jgi:RHS repeat-associated protein
MDLDGVPYVRRLAHDANGQRVLVAYGTGIMTRYCYDADSLRLARLRTEPYTVDGAGLVYRPAGAVLQDLGYGHDLAGNLVAVRDRTPGCGIAPTPDALDRAFGYDPVYRLVRADGREAASPVGELWSAGPRGDDPTATQAYAEQYRYDKAGNLLQLAHSAAIGFTRDFEVADDSNRLVSMAVGGLPYRYSYDPAGNLVSETETRRFFWNHAGRMSAFATRTAGAEPSVHAQYLYDAAGERVVKLVRRQGGAVEVVRYLGGFEHHRWAGGENNHVHVLDGTARIALVRAGPAHPDDRGPAVAYQLGDHLSSCTATVDGAGALTNREEYTPYGETSFGSYSLKRYRFTGCERDAESGLNYHSARHYAPWLARWTSPDPAGPAPGPNLYVYAADDPLRKVDVTGESPRTLTPAEQNLVARVEQFVGDAFTFARRNPGGFMQIQNAIPNAIQNLTEAQMAGNPTEELQAEVSRLRDELQNALDLQNRRYSLTREVNQVFPETQELGQRDFNHRKYLSSGLDSGGLYVRRGLPAGGGGGGGGSSSNNSISNDLDEHGASRNPWSVWRELPAQPPTLLQDQPNRHRGGPHDLGDLAAALVQVVMAFREGPLGVGQLLMNNAQGVAPTGMLIYGGGYRGRLRTAIDANRELQYQGTDRRDRQ